MATHFCSPRHGGGNSLGDLTVKRIKNSRAGQSLPVTIERLPTIAIVRSPPRQAASIAISASSRKDGIESLQSNGMAEAFLRSGMAISASGHAPMRQTVMQQISARVKHNNEVRPHKALGYRSPRGHRKTGCLELTAAAHPAQADMHADSDAHGTVARYRRHPL